MRQARILVLRGGAVGDFIVTLPVLQALRARWPDAYIELIGYPHVARLARRAGLINHLRSLDEAGIARYFAWNAALDDREQQYLASFDIVLNFLHDPDGTLNDNLKRCGVHVLISASPMVGEGHAVDHFIRPLESLAIYESPRQPELEIPPGEETSRLALPQPWIAIHPGSGGRNKCWPTERFIDLAERIRSAGRHYPVFVSSDVDTEYFPQLDRLLSPYPRLHNIELTSLAAVLSTTSLFIGNDSGIAHLSAALGRPTVALFGPTNPETWAPRGPRVSIIRAVDRRMESIPVSDVWEKVRSMSGGS